MKFIGKLFLIIFLLVIILPILGLGYLGFIPGLSSIFGTNKPRNLRVQWTEEDRTSARGKSQIEYVILSANEGGETGFQTSGSRPVSTEFSSAEASALMNNRPWRNWPYKDVQVKFNADGSGEISGVLLKDRLPAYGAKIGAPKGTIEFAMKFLPANPVFYLKMKASLKDNKVEVFEPQVFEIGRMKLPVSMFLSLVPGRLVKEAWAVDNMAKELSKVQNKRALIIEFINERLSLITGFFANSASFAENKLIFDGTLPEVEATER